MIKSIRLQNIRTFNDQAFSFEPGINLIIGSNGTGKTTILESIGLLAYGKYLSIAQDIFVISKGEEVARIEATLDGEDVFFVEIGFSAKEKIINFDSQRVPVSKLIGIFPQVSFNPETVELVFDSPALRRRELDMVLTQADRNFVIDILNFKKILKERNALLRSVSGRRAAPEELDFWNERFCTLAKKIYQARLELLDFYNQTIPEVFRRLSGKEGELTLKYLQSANYERFEESLVVHQEMDIENGLTSIGPHRDDFAFALDHRSMREGASRGEQRLAAIAFKVVASRFLISKGIQPVIILDDVFSELDHARQQAVSKTLGLFKTKQVFISTAGEDTLPGDLAEKANIIKLK